MLKEMGFSTYVEHPHKYLLQYLSILNQSTNKDLAQKAWNFMNDSLRVPLCVKFRPEVIATACIYMASRAMGIVLPEEPDPWWELFDSKQEQLDEIAWTINQLYKEPPASYISLNQNSKDTQNHSKKRNRSGSRNSDSDDKYDSVSDGENSPKRRRSRSPSPEVNISNSIHHSLGEKNTSPRTQPTSTSRT